MSVKKKVFDGFFIRLLIISFVIFSVVGTTAVYFKNTEITETLVPNHSPIFYLNDCSGVYSSETESFIYNQGLRLEKEGKGAQIAVAAVPDTGTMSLEEYSYSLAQQWGIGSEAENNGVLILFTTEEPHVRIEVGYGLEGCLNDGKCGRILDEFAVDDIHRGNWNSAAVNTYAAVAKEVYKEYGLETPSELEGVSVNENAQKGKQSDCAFPELQVTENQDPILVQIIYAFFVFWIIFITPYLIFIFVVMMFKNSSGRGGGNGGFGGGGHYYGGGFGGGFGGGGFGGGGFGGGGFGGGISGGGGSFGGGGASR